MKVNIKHKIKEFYFKEDKEGVLKKRTKGYIGEEGLVKGLANAKYFTHKELEDRFSADELEILFAFKHNKYELSFECEELDNFLKEFSNKIMINNFRNGDTTNFGKFGDVKTYIGIPKAISPMTGERYTQELFIIEGNEEQSFGGGERVEMAKAIMREKIRKHFNFEDPYKKKDTYDGLTDGEITYETERAEDLVRQITFQKQLEQKSVLAHEMDTFFEVN